jgi:hypothetical protein
MIIKIILGILLYLLIGVGVLNIMLWHDRNVGEFDEWITDDVIKFSVVLLVPISLMWVLMWLFYKAVLALINFTQTIIVAAVYMIKAAFKNGGSDERDQM